MTRCPIYVRFPFDLKAAENFPAFGHPCPNGPNRLYLSLVLIGLPVVPLHRRKEHTLVLPWPGRAFPKSRCGNRVPLLDSRNITAQQASAFFDVALRHILLFSKSFSLSAMNIGNASNFFGLILKHSASSLVLEIVSGHQFQRTKERGVIPSGTPIRNTYIEQLLRGSGIRKTHLQSLCVCKREV
jgi:hypothetical protein